MSAMQPVCGIIGVLIEYTYTCALELFRINFLAERSGPSLLPRLLSVLVSLRNSLVLDCAFYYFEMRVQSRRFKGQHQDHQLYVCRH